MLVASSTQSLLARIAGGGELHAGHVLDAELVADLHLHVGDGVSHAAALFEGRVGALDRFISAEISAICAALKV